MVLPKGPLTIMNQMMMIVWRKKLKIRKGRRDRELFDAMPDKDLVREITISDSPYLEHEEVRQTNVAEKGSPSRMRS